MKDEQQRLIVKAKRSDSKEWVYGYAMWRTDGKVLLFVPASCNTYSVEPDSVRMYSFTAPVLTDEGIVMKNFFEGEAVKIASKTMEAEGIVYPNKHILLKSERRLVELYEVFTIFGDEVTFS